MSCTRALALGTGLMLLLSGCELVADFDRGKLDSGMSATLDATVDEVDAGISSVTTVVTVKVN